MLTKLRRLDGLRVKTIDPKNKVRIIRAIEIATALGKIPKQKTKNRYDALMIGLTLPQDVIKEKIHKRLMKRMRGDALVREVKNLHARGVSWKRLHDFGLEYRFVALYLQKELSREKMLSELEKEIYRFSKRQTTWFKRDKNIKWFSLFEKSKIEKMGREIY